MLSKSLSENIAAIKKELPVDKCFDIVDRRIKVGNTEGYMVFVDGFCKDEIMYYIISHLQEIDKDLNAYDTINNELAYVEVDRFFDATKLKKMVLAGNVALVIEGSDTGILLDVREYPIRSIGESEVEKITRGSKDSFVETIIMNTALIRRRLRDENLIFEIHEVSTRAKTDVVVGYLDDRVDKALLEKIKDSLKNINLESLVMNEKTIEELLFERKWYNIFPQVKYTQRPDTCANQLLEGDIVIMVDTSPVAMILPVTLFTFTQYIEDYFETSIVGTYTRFLRVLAILTSLFITPMWLLIVKNQNIIPKSMEFLLPDGTPDIPFILQLVLVTLSFDILTMATLHAGSSISSTFGFIGGLLIGELGITLGYFAPETVFFSVITVISGHCVPNKELESAIKIVRWFLLVGVGFFGILGLIIFSTIMFVLAANTKTLSSEKPYLWPVIPFNKKAFKNSFFRPSFTKLNNKIKNSK